MTLLTAVLTSLFMVSLVFFVLIMLWVVLRIMGAIFVSIERWKNQPAPNNQPTQNQ